jgi:outer membrane receptor protein involved in Fe transport
MDELSLGLDIGYSDYDFDLYVLADSIWIYDTLTGEKLFPLDTGSTITIKEKTGTGTYSGFMQYRRDFGKYITANAGLRLTGMHYIKKLHYSPRLSLTTHLDDKTDLSLSYGKHYQQPPWFMLASNGSKSGLDYYHTDHYIAGISRLLAEDIKASVEVYYKEYKDEPVSSSEITDYPGDRSFEFVNYVGGYSKGIEFFIQKKVKNGFWGTFSHSYSIARQDDPRSKGWTDTVACPYTEYPKDFDYGHTGTLILGWQHDFLNDSWYKNAKQTKLYKAISWFPGVPASSNEYSLRFRYMGKKPYTEQEYIPMLREWGVQPGSK